MNIVETSSYRLIGTLIFATRRTPQLEIITNNLLVKRARPTTKPAIKLESPRKKFNRMSKKATFLREIGYYRTFLYNDQVLLNRFFKFTKKMS